MVLGLGIFIGCGGGAGNGDDPIPASLANGGSITGTLSKSGVLANVLAVMPNISADVSLNQAVVYLEENPPLRGNPSASGTYFIGSVPFGSYYVVASMTSASGLVYKIRSAGTVTITSAAPAGQMPLVVTSADKADRFVEVTVKDASGTAVTGATVVIWGEAFTNLGGGVFRSPPMAPTGSGNITVTPPTGANLSPTTILGVTFTAPASMTPTIGVTLSPTGSTNHAPIVSGISAQPSTTVSVGGSVTLVASASDLDGDPLVGNWTAPSGTLSGAGTTSVTWTAPSTPGTYTVYYTVTESVAGRSPLLSASASISLSTVALVVIPTVQIVATVSTQIGGGTVVTMTASPSTFTTYNWTLGNGLIVSGQGTGVLTWQAPTTLPIGSTTTSLITLDVVSGTGSAASATKTLTVLGPPKASILSFVPVAPYYPGTIRANGLGRDALNQTLATTLYHWSIATSPGALAEVFVGTPLVATYVTGTTYQIQLAVTDTWGQTTATSTTIVIGNRPPTATIASPTNNIDYLNSTTMTCIGSGTDVEDGPLTGTSLSWSSSLNGVLGTGNNLPVLTSGLTLGTHTITLTAADSTLNTSTATRSVYINARPVMTITAPLNNAAYFGDPAVTFTGNGVDLDVLTTSSFAWFINQGSWVPFDGGNASGTTFLAALTPPYSTAAVNLPSSPAGFQIALTGIDPYNQIGTSTAVTMYTGLPYPNILTINGVAPASGTRYDTATTLNFSGIPNTTGNLTMQWVRDLGVTPTLLGTGATYSTTLPMGWHSIAFIGTDSANIATYAQTGVWIDTLPSITSMAVTTPATQYATAPANVPIYLMSPTAFTVISATANDADTGAVPAASISWSVNGGLTFTATGSTLTYNFAPGTQTVVIHASVDIGFYASATLVFWVWEAEQYGAGQGITVNGAAGITGGPSDDALFLAEPGSSQIQKLERDTGVASGVLNGLLASYTDPASLSASLIDVACDGSVILSLETSGRIRRFSPGDLASAGNDLNPAGLVTPRGIAYGANVIYIADTSNLKAIHPLNGSVLNTIAFGANPPQGIGFAATMSNYIYGTDATANVLKRYDTGFNLDLTFPGTGATTAQRVALGAQMVLVSGGAANQIHVFSYSGNKLFSFGSAGAGLGQFSTPAGMTMIGNSDLYIVDSGNSRITRIRHGLW